MGQSRPIGPGAVAPGGEPEQRTLTRAARQQRDCHGAGDIGRAVQLVQGSQPQAAAQPLIERGVAEAEKGIR